jgi:hypothetical protein
MRLAEAQKRASSATAAGDHREALKWHLRALALAKVHVAAVTAAGGRLSRDEATAAARTHMAIAETYEASKGLGLASSRAEPAGASDGSRRKNRNHLDRLDREASDMAGLTQAVTHLQHAIGACGAAFAPANASEPGGEERESIARALRETKLEARARLGPRLLAVGRDEDAAETTRRALEQLSEDVTETDRSRSNTRMELLLCAADAERAVGERFAARARDLKLRARAAAAAVASAAADADAAAAVGRSGDEVYAEKARLARTAADKAEAGEAERRDAEAEASRRFEASETRLDEAEAFVAASEDVSGDALKTKFTAAVLTRRRSLRRARRDWLGAAACVTSLLALAEQNGGALPGTNHSTQGSAAGALLLEAAELCVRAKAFEDARAHAAAAAEALRDPITKKHTAASVRASGTLAFITARLGDLAGAAQMYRDARHAALATKAFGAATETSADLADLEAALGSVRFAMSEASDADGDEDPVATREGEEVDDEDVGKRETKAREAAEAAARRASRRRRLTSVAALEEALGCFARAADIERLLGGAYSARCVELENRADACASALAEERAEGEDGAPFL